MGGKSNAEGNKRDAARVGWHSLRSAPPLPRMQ